MNLDRNPTGWVYRSAAPRVLVYIAGITAIVAASLELTFIYWLAGLFSAAAVFWASEQNAASSQLLQQKSEEIERLTSRNAALVTGGDSFCYLEISNLDDGYDAGMCVVVQQGDYPLYGVSARVVDLQRFAELSQPLDFYVLKGDLELDIGDMAAGSATLETDQPLVLGDVEVRDFNIFFNARNGFFYQELHLRRCEGNWLRSTRVVRDNEVIFEKEDPGYPHTTTEIPGVREGESDD